MNYYLSVLKNYTGFSGRAKRAEYWYFMLFNFIVFLILSLIEVLLGIAPTSTTDNGVITSIYQLAVLLPSLAVSIRRMHDVNKSGWFILVPIYNFILAVTNGTRGENRFGPDPKEIETSSIPNN